MNTVMLPTGEVTRFAEENSLRPKPMAAVGGKPIPCNIMNIFSHYGLSDFAVALCFKGDQSMGNFVEYDKLSGNSWIEMNIPKPIVRREKEQAQ